MVKNHKWNTADTITSVRIVCSLFLLFLPFYSSAYLVVYTITGLTDAMDGWLARKTGTASDFGARLDSIADLLFYGSLLFRLLPVIYQTLPAAIWYVVLLIILFRVAAYGVAAIRYHRFAALHTWLNKLTGAAVFLLPYVLSVSVSMGYCWIVCILAFAASVEELFIHLRQKEYCAERKMLFCRDV